MFRGCEQSNKSISGEMAPAVAVSAGSKRASSSRYNAAVQLSYTSSDEASEHLEILHQFEARQFCLVVRSLDNQQRV